MVVQRTPPPVYRSPRKDPSASEASFSSFSSQTSQARKIGKLASSSAASHIEPSTPVQSAALSDFPSLDQMAAVSKEQRSASRPANRAAFAAAFPASGSAHIPSSLPRPTAQVNRGPSNDGDENRPQRPARSSLTNGAIQRARQQAGDETPLGVSQARAARQAAVGAPSKANSSLLADDSGDSTAQLVPGRRDAATDPILANIDVENPQLPSLSQPVSTTASTTQVAQTNGAHAVADMSTSSQASIFGTRKRRNGADQPISGASAGTAYDFSKYLDGELDPFNRASRANPRRESRPLPAQQMPVDDVDEAETSADTTARGGPADPSNTVPSTAPVESTPLISRVKAAAVATPRMSPHASPSVSSRKFAHLSSLSNGHTTSIAGNVAQSAAGDASTASLASHNRFEPSARTDRIQTMELGELRKRHTALVRELVAVEDALASAKEESEGWASECTGLQEQLTTLKSDHQIALGREARARSELQVRLSQYKIEADERAWKLLGQRRQACLIDVALQHAKNEATYHEGRYHATESELEGQKDELRLRLMLERKRADLLALHVKAALRDGARLKRRLIAKSSALNELQRENEKLAEQLEDARGSRHAGGKDEVAALRQKLEEAQAEIETLNERDAMMAETRKKWKAERKQLLAQVEELSSAPAPAAVHKIQQPMEVARAAKLSKPLVASQMLPPSSPVYAKKKSRQPMQGASELGPPSEDYDDGGVGNALAARKTTTAKTTLPLVPFAHMSSKTAPVKKAEKPVKAVKTKASKDWRAITDSSEEGSDDGQDRRLRGRRAGADSDSEQDSDDGRRAKTKSSKQKSSVRQASALRTKVSQAKKAKAAPAIDYNDQTADPSATPVIRSNKRNVPRADSDNDEPADSSVLGAKFGRDRTNFTLAPNAKAAKTSKISAQPAAAQDRQKKKKRKLLGGGGAMQWGGATGAANDAAGLAPNFDIPLELSPIKGGAAEGKGGAGAALLAGLGMPTRNFFV
ncbi:hypothetical protein NDA13_003116 [Ustilago tritici]|nr:hypothetical protein NDA13_003116 [Ustilago tritici]